MASDSELPDDVREAQELIAIILAMDTEEVMDRSANRYTKEGMDFPSMPSHRRAMVHNKLEELWGELKTMIRRQRYEVAMAIIGVIRAQCKYWNVLDPSDRMPVELESINTVLAALHPSLMIVQDYDTHLDDN